jgi:hypothetical protein
VRLLCWLTCAIRGSSSLQDRVTVLDNQVQELQADKARLTEENRHLQNRTTILEKNHAMNEEQILVLKRKLKVPISTAQLFTLNSSLTHAMLHRLKVDESP